jgi:hypothetical protein
MQMDGWTDMTKSVVNFLSFAKAPKNVEIISELPVRFENLTCNIFFRMATIKISDDHQFFSFVI